MTAKVLPLGREPRPPRSLQEYAAREIRDGLHKRGVSQEQLAAALGIQGSTLSKRLRGAQPMTLEFVEQVETLLDLRIFGAPVTTGPDDDPFRSPGGRVNSGCSARTLPDAA